MRLRIVAALLAALTASSIGLLAASPAPAAAAETGRIASFQAASLIKTDGTYWVWGGEQSVPTQIQGLSEVKASFADNLVMKQDGTVWRWARKTPTSAETVVEQVDSLRDLIDVRVAGHAVYAIDGQGRLWSAPLASSGATGYAFVLSTALTGVAAMTDYYDDADQLVFLKQDGTVWKGTSLASLKQVASVLNAAAVQGHLLLSKDGTVWSWKTTNDEPYGAPAPFEPAQVPGLSGIRSIFTNGMTNLAIDTQSRLWFWGSTITGFSDGTTLHPQKPKLIGGLPGAKDALVAERSLIVYADNGRVYMTSIDRDLMPATPDFGFLASDIVKIAGGPRHVIMQKTDGSLLGWGVNKAAQLGVGDYDFDHLIPLPVQSPIGVYLNGEPVPLYNGVIIRSGQAFLPLRSVFEKMGAQIGWDNDAKIATVERAAAADGDGGVSAAPLKLQIDYKKGAIELNGQAVKLANDPFAVNGISYLPLRFVGEALGAKVEWQQTEGRIALTAESAAASDDSN